MTLYTLLLVICTGSTCHVVRAPMPSMQVCVLSAQHVAVELTGAGVRVERMRCEAGEPV